MAFFFMCSMFLKMATAQHFTGQIRDKMNCLINDEASYEAWRRRYLSLCMNVPINNDEAYAFMMDLALEEAREFRNMAYEKQGELFDMLDIQRQWCAERLIPL